MNWAQMSSKRFQREKAAVGQGENHGETLLQGGKQGRRSRRAVREAHRE